MSWSLPRLNCNPQRDNSSSDASVKRPLFCTAIFRRVAEPFDGLSMQFHPFGDGTVTAVAGSKTARDAADGGDADAGLPVDLAIGQAALQECNHRPAVGHGL